MEEGSFRCDANISVRAENSQKLATKVEVKNMNSFKAVYRALEFEASRQRRMMAEGKKLEQETRGWVEDKGKTVSQRSKEYAHDYRYFPEPDLPPLTLSREWVEEVRAKLPELPEARRDRFVAEYQLPVYDANLLTSSRAMADYEEEFVEKFAKIGKPDDLSKPEQAKLGSNWLLGEVSRITNANNIDIADFRKKVSPERLVRLTDLMVKGGVSGTTAKPVLEEMFRTGKDSTEIIREQGLGQISDTGELGEKIIAVIKGNSQAVADYKVGKASALKFLIGQVMRATKGRANPQVVTELLKEKLEEE